MNKSDSIGKLVAALNAAQSAFDPILKEKNNPFFKSKYADLAAVIAATQPALIANGLAVIQLPVSDTERVGVSTTLAHTSGEFVTESYTLPTAKQDAQSGVAAITYARRAAYQAILGVAAEDDDGNTAAGRRVQEDAPEPEPLLARRGRRVSIEPAQTDDSRVPQRRRQAPPQAPPAAEIPAELLGAREPGDEIPKEISSEISLEMPAAVGVVPTGSDLDVYRKSIGKLGDDLATAGLKASRNLPVNRKVIAYLLQCTGAADPTKVTTAQWEAFFQLMDKMLVRDPEELVKLVNKAAIGDKK